MPAVTEGDTKAVLFDVDGTLVDTTHLILVTLGKTYRKFLGVEIPPEEIRAVIGRPLEVQVHLFDDRTKETPDYEDMRRYQIDLYEANKNLEHPIPEAIQAVRACAARGIGTALVTSKEIREFEGTFPRLGLEGVVGACITATDSARPKPHPDPVLLAAERLGVSPAQSIFVGDTDYDMQSGQSAGARVAAVLWGAQTEDRLRVAEPDFIFRKPEELLGWCERL